jgi:hypothetical protein
MSWSQYRTGELVERPRFQALAGVVTAALLERGSLPGELIEHLLTRADVIHRKNEAS